ncbi:hypothetical protein BGX33_006680 [Mortierella sp. NVP41]|nr:hypothetical protein BGX33_006680 [Mortierella sp. NVP41]
MIHRTRRWNTTIVRNTMEVMEDKEDKETYGEDPVETEVQVETEVFTVVMVETEGGVAMEGRYLAEVVEEDAVVAVL